MPFINGHLCKTKPVSEISTRTIYHVAEKHFFQIHFVFVKWGKPILVRQSFLCNGPTPILPNCIRHESHLTINPIFFHFTLIPECHSQWEIIGLKVVAFHCCLNDELQYKESHNLVSRSAMSERPRTSGGPSPFKFKLCHCSGTLANTIIYYLLRLSRGPFRAT